jgi:hypothetical protein
MAVKEIESLGEINLITFNATVKSIKQGVMKDFISEKGIAKFKDPDQPAIELTIESETGTVTTAVFALPENYQKQGVGSRTKIGRFLDQYGKELKVGMKVKTIVENGFERLWVRTSPGKK